MSLSDRLARARGTQLGAEPPRAEPSTPATPARKRSADAHAAIKRSVHAALLESLGPTLYQSQLSESDLNQQVRVVLHDVLSRDKTPMPGAERSELAQTIADEILGYGPLEPLLRDVDVTEVMVNGFETVYVERAGMLERVEAVFTDEAHLRRTIDKIVRRVGRRVDESPPMVDARLPDGSRVNAIIPPVAVDGPALTIRKFSNDPYQIEDLMAFGTLTGEVATFLAGCVRGKANILVSGGAGAGKTTTLNVLSSFIPPGERIVTIEDAAELQLNQEHVIRLESRPANTEGRGEVTIRDLVRNALRMRPDRIVVGEVRDDAALDMLQAMNTGHDGSICTVHSNSPRDTLARVETMVLMAGVDLPVRAIREQLASAIDLVVQQTRGRDGSRYITHVSEVIGLTGDIVTMQDIFVRHYPTGPDTDGLPHGRIVATGMRPEFLPKLEQHGVYVDASVFTPGRSHA